ncbi:MAG: sensor histidine kinase [Oscillospiraceae bacterium]
MQTVIIVILTCIAAALIIALIAVQLRTKRILDSVDKMLDEAIDNTFSESHFSEEQLSRIESKMNRYITKGVTSQKLVSEERDHIKTLISDISHQTKTPISNIMVYSQLLAEEELPHSARRLAEQIEEQTEKLSFLISSLVKTSRLENGIVSAAPSENSVKALLDEIHLENAAAEKNITLTIQNDTDITALFDPKWTSEALVNIIDNAVKYTPEGGSVTVSVTEYEMFARIDISDTGIGISEEEIPKIFQRFYRSPEVSGKSGVGIGLYLARKIISDENGYIKVASEKGKGSVFSVFLPKK